MDKKLIRVYRMDGKGFQEFLSQVIQSSQDGWTLDAKKFNKSRPAYRNFFQVTMYREEHVAIYDNLKSTKVELLEFCKEFDIPVTEEQAVRPASIRKVIKKFIAENGPLESVEEPSEVLEPELTPEDEREPETSQNSDTEGAEETQDSEGEPKEAASTGE